MDLWSISCLYKAFTFCFNSMNKVSVMALRASDSIVLTVCLSNYVSVEVELNCKCNCKHLLGKLNLRCSLWLNSVNFVILLRSSWCLSEFSMKDTSFCITHVCLFCFGTTCSVIATNLRVLLQCPDDCAAAEMSYCTFFCSSSGSIFDVSRIWPSPLLQLLC